MIRPQSQQPNSADIELLSAYIDGQLGQAERASLEQRLEREPALRRELDELASTVGLLRELAPARPPRSFTLDPQAVTPRRWWFPWMQFGSAAVAVALMLVFGFALSGGMRSSSSTAAAPTMAAAAQAPVAAAEPTAAPAAEAAPAAAALAEATADPAARSAADQAGVTAAPAAEAPTAAPQPSQPPPSLAAGTAEATPEVALAAAPTQAPAEPSNAAPPSTGDNGAGAALPAEKTAATTEPAGALYSEQVATSGSSSPDTLELAQPAATPAAPGGGAASNTPLLLGAAGLALLIGLGLYLARRKR